MRNYGEREASAFGFSSTEQGISHNVNRQPARLDVFVSKLGRTSAVNPIAVEAGGAVLDVKPLLPRQLSDATNHMHALGGIMRHRTERNILPATVRFASLKKPRLLMCE